MNKNIDEKLFFKMMHFSRMMRRDMAGGPHHGPEMRGPHGPHHGHGPCGGPGPHRGPGPCGERGMHRGPGPHHGPDPRKMRAFAQNRLMGLLLDHEDGVRQKVLAEEMRINSSSTSELISKLESEGYVMRTVDPSDKRATLISLTEVGRARAYELEDERNERFAKAFEPLTAKEKEQLLKLLEKLMPTPEEAEK